MTKPKKVRYAHLSKEERDHLADMKAASVDAQASAAAAVEELRNREPNRHYDNENR